MSLLNLPKRLARELLGLSDRLAETRRAVDEQKMLTARLLVNQLRARGPVADLREAEFKVFSQFGDDGIIQYLINEVAPGSRTFIEFGVEDYTESNTRFLLVNDNWRGLVLDGSEANVERIRRDEIYWRHDLTAASAFVTRENVNDLFAAHGFAGELGLLSIDIDGNDYWVWEAVEVVRPAIVVAEYNSVFGARRAVTVPYDPAFRRTAAHPSNLYFGCSLRALDVLARRKGYAFAGSNSAGNNAYFVRLDKMGKIARPGVEEGYVESRFRESRDAAGRLTFLAGEARRRAIEELEVFDVEENRLVRIREL